MQGYRGGMSNKLKNKKMSKFKQAVNEFFSSRFTWFLLGYIIALATALLRGDIQ